MNRASNVNLGLLTFLGVCGQLGCIATLAHQTGNPSYKLNLETKPLFQIKQNIRLGV